MSIANTLLKRRFPHKPPALTEDELHRLWKVALSDDEAANAKVVGELAKAHPCLKDGVFLF